MPRLPTPRRRWSVADARAVLTALEESRLSPGAFAERERIDVQRLYRWRRRLGGELVAAAPKATPEFVEIRAVGAELVEVVLRSGRVLRVAESIAPTSLARLVAALERTESC
jgi:transposase